MTLNQYYQYVISRPWISAGNDAHYCIETEALSNTVHLYFEQTPNARGWELNFDFPAVPYKRERKELWFAHAGFVVIWKSIRDEVLGKIKALNPPHITVSGYSQGAAISVLAFEDLQYIYGDIVRGITFAAPRVLWMPTKRMKRRFRRLTMYKNRGDVVTNVPFKWMGFAHVGIKVPLGPAAFPWPTHHMPDEYIKNLPDTEM